MKKHYLLAIVFLITIIALPIIINWLILKPQLFNTVGDGSTWLLFWATYISAVASFAMVFITWLTLKESRHQNQSLIKQNEELILQNSQQLSELKRQWEESHRPFLIISVITHSGGYFLKIQNSGKEIAKNVTVTFSKSFIDNLLFKGTGRRLSSLQTPFFIEPESSKYYYITPCRSTGNTFSCDDEACTSDNANAWLDEHIADIFDIDCSYSEKYSAHESISLQMFSSPAASLNDPATDYLGWIKKGLVYQNTYHKPIQASLESLATAMQSIDKKIVVEKEETNNQTNTSTDDNK